MTDEMDFFDGIGGGGAPSAKLSNPGDFVVGEVVAVRTVDYVPFGKTEPEKLDNGNVRKQLVVTLQTELRNWEGVNKIPRVNREDPNSPEKPGSEDEGLRNVYIPQFKNIHYAVADALRAAKSKLVEGGKFGVKVDRLEESGKGNPKKVHKATYEPPAPKAASEDFFAGSSAPATQEAPAQQDPWGTTQSAKAPF